MPLLNLCLEFVLKIVNLKLIFSPLHLLLRHLILHSIQLIFHHLHLNLILLGLILEREFLLLLIIDLNLNPLDLFLYFHLWLLFLQLKSLSYLSLFRQVNRNHLLLWLGLPSLLLRCIPFSRQYSEHFNQMLLFFGKNFDLLVEFIQIVLQFLGLLWVYVLLQFLLEVVHLVWEFGVGFQ